MGKCLRERCVPTVAYGEKHLSPDVDYHMRLARFRQNHIREAA